MNEDQKDGGVTNEDEKGGGGGDTNEDEKDGEGMNDKL